MNSLRPTKLRLSKKSLRLSLEIADERALFVSLVCAISWCPLHHLDGNYVALIVLNMALQIIGLCTIKSFLSCSFHDKYFL